MVKNNWKRKELLNGAIVVNSLMKGKNIPSLNIWFKYGLYHSIPKSLVHLIEHCSFYTSSTKNKTKGYILNGLVFPEATCFYARAFNDNLFEAFKDLINIAYKSPNISQKQLEIEKRIIKNEIRRKSVFIIYSLLINLLYPEINLIDGIFCGEADEQILKIAERSKLGKNFKNIKGMAFTENGEIIYEPLDKAPDLDFSYLPARDAITQIDNQNPSQKIVKILSISSSRGCIGNCIYCTIPNFYKKPYKEWTIWRGRAANIVVNEIENLIELFKPNWFENFITFVDDDFLSVSDARERAYQIADEILTRKIKGFYKFSSRADSLLKDIKLLKYLYKAGFVSVFIGVEGGTDKVLKIYRKGLKIDQIKKAIHLLRDINMFRYDIGFILFNPFISIEELFKSAAFLKDIGIGTPSIWFWQLQALPGTSFEETLINDNLAKPNFSHFLPYEYYFIDKKVERICQFIMKHVQNERIILNMSGLLSKLADILLLLKRLKKIKKEVVEKLDKTLQSYQQKLANENFNFLKKLEKNIKESDESWNIIKAQYINKLEKFYSEISKISIYTIKMIHRHYNDNSTTGI